MTRLRSYRNVFEEEEFNPFEVKDNTVSLRRNLDRIDQRDIRSKFKCAQDPINLAFRRVEDIPLKALAKDFIKESFFDFVSFISDVCK